MISGSTRLVALLGRPVAESLSPRMQNAAFAARGLDWAYVACEVAPERFEAAVRGLDALGFPGANVTIPHKRAAAELCDEAEGPSVNTLVFRDGRNFGFNTDKEIVAGIEASRVCLIGAGGAAAALLPALAGEVSALTSTRRSGRISQMCSLSTSAERESVSARMPPHQPVPITATSTWFTRCPLIPVLSSPRKREPAHH